MKDFNQRFNNLLNWILENPAESIQVEFYTTALPPTIDMFVKALEKRTLAENFLESIKLEKDMASIYEKEKMKRINPLHHRRIQRRVRNY